MKYFKKVMAFDIMMKIRYQKLKKKFIVFGQLTI